MKLREDLLDEINRAQKMPYIPAKVIGEFEEFISTNDNLLRSDNKEHHVCTFFLPVHVPSRSVYLVHHIKAQDWIPPGGHIDPGESPVDTVKREYAEEISYRIANEPVRLINLTIKHISTTRHPCKTHYDFWYAVLMSGKVPFVWDRNEFYDASWFPFDEAVKKVSLPLYRRALMDGVFPFFS